MKEFVSLQDVRLASKSGHVAVMKAGKPRGLPEELHLEARAHGCVPVDEAKAMSEAAPSKEEPEQAESKQDEPMDEGRAADIRSAIELLIASNDPANFNAHGVPKVKAVEDIVGYSISAANVREVFNELKSED